MFCPVIVPKAGKALQSFHHVCDKVRTDPANQAALMLIFLRSLRSSRSAQGFLSPHLLGTHPGQVSHKKPGALCHTHRSRSQPVELPDSPNLISSFSGVLRVHGKPLLDPLSSPKGRRLENLSRKGLLKSRVGWTGRDKRFYFVGVLILPT